jgi:hypothetical protein
MLLQLEAEARCALPLSLPANFSMASVIIRSHSIGAE